MRVTTKANNTQGNLRKKEQSVPGWKDCSLVMQENRRIPIDASEQFHPLLQPFFI
jgi:hypothetical protein